MTSSGWSRPAEAKQRNASRSGWRLDIAFRILRQWILFGRPYLVSQDGKAVARDIRDIRTQVLASEVRCMMSMAIHV